MRSQIIAEIEFLNSKQKYIIETLYEIGTGSAAFFERCLSTYFP